MKVRHNPNGSWERPSAVVHDDYQREVQRSTERLERMYAQAEKRLHAAEQRLLRAQARPAINARALRELDAVVQMRRDELNSLMRLMVATAASATHRGRKSFRPVPPQPA